MSTPAPESIGARLTAARTAAGLTLSAAAARLRCDESLLAALEAERYGDIGAPVFVQGHLRRYADLLGLPTEVLLADWTAAHRSALAAPDLTQLPRPNRPVLIVDPGKIARPLAMLAATVVIALAAWWILQGAGTNVPSTVVVETPPVAASQIEPAVESVVEPAIDSSIDPPVDPMAASLTAPGSVPTAAPTTPTAAQAPISTPTPAMPQRAAAALAVSPSPALSASSAVSATAGRSGVLALAVSAECWLEIFDASGARRYFALAPAGERLRISGPAPWRVVVGRADAVTFELGDRRVTIPSSFVRNATAYVSVDAVGRVQPAEVPR